MPFCQVKGKQERIEHKNESEAQLGHLLEVVLETSGGHRRPCLCRRIWTGTEACPTNYEMTSIQSGWIVTSILAT
jgi:hypothetical protein